MMCQAAQSGIAHPTGVQPLGARLARGSSDNRTASLGALAVLDDALLLQLLSALGARDLVAFSAASRAAYCFGNHEELWKALVLQVRAQAGHNISMLDRDGGAVEAEAEEAVVTEVGTACSPAEFPQPN